MNVPQAPFDGDPACSSSSMSSVYSIADITLDAGRQLVSRDGERIALGALTYKLLLLLVSKAPALVTHDDIADAVWDGRAVSPETVKQRVKLLRDALGDDPKEPRYIEVARGQGYRLVPRVEQQGEKASGTPGPRWRIPALTGLAVVAAVSIVVWMFWPRGESTSEPPSIAVLPFVDTSPEQDDDYFAQGLAEDILNLLSKSTSLKVMARTSSFQFKGQDADVAKVANALHVSHVLEGSVRKSGDHVHVSVQLVEASDSTEVWSNSYDEDVGDILMLQAQIATSVAGSLKAELLGTPASVSGSARPVNPQAFDLYLRGQQELRAFTAASLATAEGYFKRAIELDPDFIPSYYRLGLVYVLQVMDVQVPIAENRRKLEDVVRRGLALAPDNAGLIGLRGQLERYDGESALAERDLRHAMELDPSNIPVRILNSMFAIDSGHPDQSLRIARRSLEIDPLNSVLWIGMPFGYIDLWDARDALAAASHLRQIPGAPQLPLNGIVKMYLLGDFAGAIRDMRAFMRGKVAADEIPYGTPNLYFDLGDLRSGDAAIPIWRKYGPQPAMLDAIKVQQLIAHGKLDSARVRAIDLLEHGKGYTAYWSNDVVARIATDALIESGHAQHAVDLIETLAPIFADFKRRHKISVQALSPAPFLVKCSYSSFPAVYYPDYIHALRAAGDEAGADNMLDHLHAILQDRRRRGLLLEERYTAEELALRGKDDAALDALEKAETDRTIYRNWEIFLLHNSLFSAIRNRPRYVALVERVRREMARQLAELDDSTDPNPNT
jgi:TolB-like protein/DNA-binding winged helix-turn-helix (wHTH) protein